MKEKTKEKLANLLRIIILSAIFSTVIGYSFAAWTPPAGAPPFNNVPPPINVGGATQERAGNLILDNWLIAKKAQTQSTVASDVGTTVATKDYVDGKAAAAGGTLSIDVYRCPNQGTCEDGQTITGAWASFGCNGQISHFNSCYNAWWNNGGHGCSNVCPLIGKLRIN